jgi:hypothetical protein
LEHCFVGDAGSVFGYGPDCVSGFSEDLYDLTVNVFVRDESHPATSASG